MYMYVHGVDWTCMYMYAHGVDWTYMFMYVYVVDWTYMFMYLYGVEEQERPTGPSPVRPTLRSCLIRDYCGI